jgi:hypothetical protein
MKGLVRYTQRNLSRRYTVDQIRLTLIQQGYSRAAVDKAIKIAHESMPKAPAEVKLAPKIELVEPEPVPARKRNFFQKIFGLNKTQISDAPPEF